MSVCGHFSDGAHRDSTAHNHPPNLYQYLSIPIPYHPIPTPTSSYPSLPLPPSTLPYPILPLPTPLDPSPTRFCLHFSTVVINKWALAIVCYANELRTRASIFYISDLLVEYPENLHSLKFRNIYKRLGCTVIAWNLGKRITKLPVFYGETHVGD